MKVLQPLLDVLLQNSELTFSGTNSMVSSIQKNVLILFRSVLALNGLGTCKWAPRYQQVQLPRGRPLCQPVPHSAHRSLDLLQGRRRQFRSGKAIGRRIQNVASEASAKFF